MFMYFYHRHKKTDKRKRSIVKLDPGPEPQVMSQLYMNLTILRYSLSSISTISVITKNVNTPNETLESLPNHQDLIFPLSDCDDSNNQDCDEVNGPGTIYSFMNTS
jgi:hypothetical protein